MCALSRRSRFAHIWIELVDIFLNLHFTSFVDYFPSHHSSDVRRFVSRWNHFALHVVNSFAQHDLYFTNTF